MRRTVKGVAEYQSDRYHAFWKSPANQYMNKLEKKIIKPLLTSGQWFIDIGGGYGRLMELYRNSFANVIILGLSLSMLQDANSSLSDNNITNVKLVAANIYSLPFTYSVFDQATMIRVIHHLQHPKKIIPEVSRIVGVEPTQGFSAPYWV